MTQKNYWNKRLTRCSQGSCLKVDVYASPVASVFQDQNQSKQDLKIGRGCVGRYVGQVRRKLEEIDGKYV